MVLRYICHNPHITVPEGQTFPQNSAAGGLKDGEINLRMRQYLSGTSGTTAVSGIDAGIVNPDTIRMSETDSAVLLLKQVGCKACGCRLPVGAGHRHNRNG
ncbi:hypothetical protein D3C81_1985660 [compost metagenome]